MESQLITVDDGVALHVARVDADRTPANAHRPVPEVVMLTGGPGCVQYLEDTALAPHGCRSWYPEPRGVGRSGGGAHTMERAVADLEAIRTALGLSDWIVLGHSWGCDLAVRYAVQHPGSVSAVVGVAGRGPQRDRTWSEEYEAGKGSEPDVPVEWSADVHAALGTSFTEWIHHPQLWRGLADCPVPMRFIAAGADVRPDWPLRQLAALVPDGSFRSVPRVPHDFWATDPDVWVEVISTACAEAVTR